MTEKIRKTAAEWLSRLTPDQYWVTREKGTERPFSGQHHDSKTPGVYGCVCCAAPLFSSDTKYDSGTGWPSFWEPVADGAVASETETTLGMARTEVLCARCDAHLGHVFPDGPPPTGQRYCINSLALTLDESE